MIVTHLLALIATAALTTAAKLSISIPPSPPTLPNPATLPPTTHAVLLGPPGTRYDALIRRDNTFHFSSLEAGSYLLTIHSRDHFFPPLRLDITPNYSPGDGAGKETISAYQTFRGNEWSNKGPHYGSGQDSLSIEVRPSGVKEFYMQRGGFNLISFLKSPMILMALFSVVMIFGMPYLMDNMDPETKAEFEEMQKKGPVMGSEGAANQIQNFDLAGWMAGKSSGGSSGGGGGGSKRK